MPATLPKEGPDFSDAIQTFSFVPFHFESAW